MNPRQVRGALAANTRAAHDVGRLTRATERSDVVVLGAGLAGLAAALAFAQRGRRVVLVERDGPVEGTDADGLFACWDRRLSPRVRGLSEQALPPVTPTRKTTRL